MSSLAPIFCDRVSFPIFNFGIAFLIGCDQAIARKCNNRQWEIL
ncbi:MAG: hypothetical protein AB4290_29385 [Spirulina sp.]